jgi:hypothetical protein
MQAVEDEERPNSPSKLVKLEQILMNCMHLIVLDIFGCNMSAPRDYRKIANLAPQLEHLVTNCRKGQSARTITYMLDQMRSLKVLKVTCKKRVKKEVMKFIASEKMSVDFRPKMQ